MDTYDTIAHDNCFIPGISVYSSSELPLVKMELHFVELEFSFRQLVVMIQRCKESKELNIFMMSLYYALTGCSPGELPNIWNTDIQSYPRRKTGRASCSMDCDQSQPIEESLLGSALSKKHSRCLKPTTASLWSVWTCSFLILSE